MQAPEQRSFSVLAAVAAAVAVAQGLTDVAELALYASPFLLLAGLLLSGRFVGEQSILRRRGAPPVARVHRERARWPHREALAPALEPVHDPRLERGPPVPATAAA